VQWSLTYVAFLWYLAAITTYHLPGANIAMVVAVVSMFASRDPIRFPPFLGWLGAFIIWAALAYPLTRYPERVQESVTVLAKIWLIALVAANTLRTRDQIRFFVIFFLACFALYPLRGSLINYYFAGYALVGRALWNFIYANPNDLAAMALLQLSMAVGLVVTERRRSLVWLAALVGAALLTLLILMTQSRGAVIALAVFALLLVASRRRRPLVLLTAATLAVGVAMIAPGGVWTRMSGLTKATNTADLRAVDAEGSAQERFEIWKVAVKVIRDQPVLGVGLGAYRPAHAMYALDGPFSPGAKGERDTHNTVLTVLAETGAPGLMLFLALLITTLWKAERIRRAWGASMPRTSQQLLCLQLGLLAFLVAGIFGSLAYLSFLYIQLVLIWTLADVCRREALGVDRRPLRASPVDTRSDDLLGAKRVSGRRVQSPDRRRVEPHYP
jgi:probable O-glycosylation ligase (exosortase A-associated)